MEATIQHKGAHTARRGGLIVFLFAALFAAGSASGSASGQTPGKSDFDAGVQAAGQGAYARAIDHFLQANEKGLDTGALHYNLGVSFYKTGRVEAAKKAFSNAARHEEMAAPAYYQLGRIAREQNRPAEARRMFRKAYRHARTDRVRRAALQALGGDAPKAARRWLLWAEFGAGHDDNALLVPPDLSGASDEDDTFYNTTLYGYYDFRDRNRQPGLRLHALVADRRYSDLDAFDYNATEAGVSYPFGGRDWTTRLGVAARSSRFGGNDYQDSTLASIEVRGPLSSAWRLKSELSHESVDPAAVYSFLEGNKTELEFEFRRRGGLELSYAFETNDRDDLAMESTGEFRSFSPARHRLGVDYQHAFTRRWALLLGAGLRQSRYADADVRDNGTTMKREDDRLQGRLGLAWDLGRQWRLEATADHTDNDSNFNEFDYDRTTVNVSLSGTFSGR